MASGSSWPDGGGGETETERRRCPMLMEPCGGRALVGGVDSGSEEGVVRKDGKGGRGGKRVDVRRWRRGKSTGEEDHGGKSNRLFAFLY